MIDEDVEMTLMETDKGAGINQVSPDQTPSTDLLPLSREDLRKLMSKQVVLMSKGAYLNRIIKLAISSLYYYNIHFPQVYITTLPHKTKSQ